MAQKNITYDIGGKIKEVSGSYYDDVSNTLVVKNLSVNEISLPNLQDGIAFVSGTTISSSGGAVNGKVVTWNSSTNQWGFSDPTYVDVNIENPAIAASSDISGTFRNEDPYIQVKSLSNVNTGNPLPVARGGTGLSAATIPSGESLLIGNGTNPFTFVAASNNSSRSALLSNGSSWELTNITDVTSSVEISIFTSSATWTRPAGTKMIRVLAQGGGGGGGSGANRNSAIASTGGSGGGAGGFIDSGIFTISEDSVLVIVGSGGLGANYPIVNSSGLPGNNGSSSSFGNYVYANGGNRGAGGLLSATGVAGGASVSYGTDIIYDAFTYNVIKISNTGSAGAASTSTTGGSVVWATSSNTYFGSGGGGAGGSVDLNNIIYDGGNGGTLIINKGTALSPNATFSVSSSILSLLETNISNTSQVSNLFIASGGGGGAGSSTAGGGLGSAGAWGSGGGGGGASTNGSSGTRQGGNGGDGYVAVISYKY